MTKQITKETAIAMYPHTIKIAEGELHNLLYEEKPASHLPKKVKKRREIKMIRETREISRAEYRHLRRQEANLEALKVIAWVIVLTVFFFLAGWAVL